MNNEYVLNPCISTVAKESSFMVSVLRRNKNHVSPVELNLILSFMTEFYLDNVLNDILIKVILRLNIQQKCMLFLATVQVSSKVYDIIHRKL